MQHCWKSRVAAQLCIDEAIRIKHVKRINYPMDMLILICLSSPFLFQMNCNMIFSWFLLLVIGVCRGLLSQSGYGFGIITIISSALITNGHPVHPLPFSFPGNANSSPNNSKQAGGHSHDYIVMVRMNELGQVIEMLPVMNLLLSARQNMQTKKAIADAFKGNVKGADKITKTVSTNYTTTTIQPEIGADNLTFTNASVSSVNGSTDTLLTGNGTITNETIATNATSQANASTIVEPTVLMPESNTTTIHSGNITITIVDSAAVQVLNATVAANCSKQAKQCGQNANKPAAPTPATEPPPPTEAPEYGEDYTTTPSPHLGEPGEYGEMAEGMPPQNLMANGEPMEYP